MTRGFTATRYTASLRRQDGRENRKAGKGGPPMFEWSNPERIFRFLFQPSAAQVRDTGIASRASTDYWERGAENCVQTSLFREELKS
jgi:hypothetical protein